MSEVIGTYKIPAHGWTCFHCGENFRSVGAARDHFGHEPHAEPGCRIKAGEEKGLLIELRKAEQTRDENLKRAIRAEEDAEVAHRDRQDVLRVVGGAKSAHEARCAWDTLEGRAIAAEATLREIEAIQPGLVECARDTVCRPSPHKDCSK